MWLLHTTDIRLTAFIEGSIPEYAILSHTWTNDEISYSDIQNLSVAKLRAGWQKIAQCCKRASGDGYVWVWIDTCCIDKSSSAELSEAINSMWEYYKQAKECYAYLADVPPVDPALPIKHGFLHDKDLTALRTLDPWREKFAGSRWYTRGWTLQELLAPRTLIFLAQDWSSIGYKQDLQETVKRVTGIEDPWLQGTSLETASIARKMSWAAKRVTTRTEDIAYCLLGILGVNMPLIYGEGRKAFKRLQLELIRVSADQSIFAWKSSFQTKQYVLKQAVTTPWNAHRRVSNDESILAHSPSCFADCGDITDDCAIYGMAPFTVTNAGVRIRLQSGPLPPLSGQSNWHYQGEDLRILMLNCSRSKDQARQRIGIALRITGQVGEKEDGNPVNHAVRAFPDYLHSDWRSFSWKAKTIYLQYLM